MLYIIDEMEASKKSRFYATNLKRRIKRCLTWCFSFNYEPVPALSLNFTDYIGFHEHCESCFRAGKDVASEFSSVRNRWISVEYENNSRNCACHLQRETRNRFIRYTCSYNSKHSCNPRMSVSLEYSEY